MTKLCKECLSYKDLNEYGLCITCENKKSIIYKLNIDKDRINNKINLIRNLKIEPVTEDTWKQLCDTPLRYNDILLDLAKVTFPYGKDFKRNINDISFKMNGFTISVPTCKSSGITIDMEWYNPSKLKDFIPQDRYKKMRRYFELLDDSNSKWYDLAESRCSSNLTRPQLFRWWILKGKWQKINREKWEKKFKLEDIKNSEKYLKYQEEKDKLNTQIKEFHKTVDILKNWSEVKGYVLHNGIYSTINIEDFLR